VDKDSGHVNRDFRACE